METTRRPVFQQGLEDLCLSKYFVYYGFQVSSLHIAMHVFRDKSLQLLTALVWSREIQQRQMNMQLKQ